MRLAWNETRGGLNELSQDRRVALAKHREGEDMLVFEANEEAVSMACWVVVWTMRWKGHDPEAYGHDFIEAAAIELLQTDLLQ